MAHELYELTDGRQSIGYVSNTPAPWHGLGQVIPENTPLEEWAKLAGLDWKVLSAPAYYHFLSHFFIIQSKLINSTAIFKKNDSITI